MNIKRLRGILKKINSLYDINDYDVSLSDHEMHIVDRKTLGPDGKPLNRVLVTVACNTNRSYEVVWIDFSLIEAREFPLPETKRFDLEVDDVPF